MWYRLKIVGALMWLHIGLVIALSLYPEVISVTVDSLESANSTGIKRFVLKSFPLLYTVLLLGTYIYLSSMLTWKLGTGKEGHEYSLRKFFTGRSVEEG